MVKRVSRREFLRMAGGTAALGVLAACAPKPTPTEAPEEVQPAATVAPAEVEPSVVTWWNAERGGVMTDAHKEVAETYLEVFQAENPGIKIDMEYGLEEGFDDKLYTAFAAGEAPDVWAGIFAPEVARRGFLADLTPYMEVDKIKPEELWFEIGILRSSYNDRFYAVPRDGTAGIYGYNKDLFDELGVAYPKDDWTVADLREIAIKLTDEEKGTYGLGGNEGSIGAVNWGPLSYNLGVDFVSDDGHQVKGHMDTPEAIAALEWYYNLTAEDKVTTHGSPVAEQMGWFTFLSGKVGMQSFSSWEIVELDESATFEWGLVTPPCAKKGATHWAWTDAIIFYLWAESKVPDAGWKFLRFLSGREAGKIAAEARVWTPVIPDVWLEAGWDKDPIWGAFWKEMQKPTKVPNYLRSEFQWECIGPAWDATWTRYVEEGERPLDAIVHEEVATAQDCLDKPYAGAK